MMYPTFFVAVFTILMDFSQGQLACGDNTWVQYTDTKCFKLVNRLVNRVEADKICSVDPSASDDTLFPTSLTIKSKEEQQFLADYVFNVSGIENNVWLGAKRKTNFLDFIWDDNTVVEYTNWGVGSPSNVMENQCTQMNSKLSKRENFLAEVGKWTDVSCDRRNIVVCQKLQSWSILQLQKWILKLGNDLAISNNEIQTNKVDLLQTNSRIECVKSSLLAFQRKQVPVGFIYTQLHGQPTPSSMWPEFSWLDISSSYSGQFFRVVGGNSSSFGTVQNGNAPRITAIRSSEVDSITNNDYQSVPVEGHSTGWLYTGEHGGNKPYVGIDLYSSGGEVRPVNQAIKLWKRTS